MARNMITRYIDNKMYNRGLFSDVPYWVFCNVYPMTTSMYQMDLKKWSPVLFTWTISLETHHYKAHFVALLKQIKEAEMGPSEKDQLTQQVVNFSDAQKNGFINAYTKIFPGTTKDDANSQLKGCHEHFWQSVTRIKRNWSMILAPMDLPSYFFLLLLLLLYYQFYSSWFLVF